MSAEGRYEYCPRPERIGPCVRQVNEHGQPLPCATCHWRRREQPQIQVIDEPPRFMRGFLREADALEYQTVRTRVYRRVPWACVDEYGVIARWYEWEGADRVYGPIAPGRRCL